MARKGTVKRMSSAALPEAKPEPGEGMPDRWLRSQDHFTRFTDLIKQELDDETHLVEERWKTGQKADSRHQDWPCLNSAGGQEAGFSVMISSCLNHVMAGECPTTDSPQAISS